MRRLVLLLGLLALVAACLPVASASALAFPVTSLEDSKAKGTLRASIEEADLSSGPDSIPIEVTGTIRLESVLPPLSEVTIIGPGADSLTVERTGSTPFRIFYQGIDDVTVSGLTVSGGKAQYGAGFLNEGPGRLTLIHVVVTGNEAFQEGTGATFAHGGGVRSFGPLTIRESVISGNSSVARGDGETTLASGGGVEAYDATTIERSTISGNVVETYAEEGGNSFADGGGLFLAGPPAEIEESTISGNSTHATEGNPSAISKGGGFFAYRADITGSTITGNSAAAEDNGGEFAALGANAYAFENLVFRDTIVADPMGAIDSCAGALIAEFTSSGFNLDEDDSCGFGKSSDLSGVVPGLEPLADNGGPTPTHALRADSPAIDRGSAFGLALDQRGLPRPSDFASISNSEGGDGSDIGAFELQAPPVPSAGGGPAVVTEQPADTTPPNTRIVSGPARLGFKRLAKFRFASTEAQSSFQCKLDKKKWRACANPFKRSVKPGRHLFKVRAIDRFGNVDPSPARFGWRVKPLS